MKSIKNGGFVEHQMFFPAPIDHFFHLVPSFADRYILDPSLLVRDVEFDVLNRDRADLVQPDSGCQSFNTSSTTTTTASTTATTMATTAATINWTIIG